MKSANELSTSLFQLIQVTFCPRRRLEGLRPQLPGRSHTYSPLHFSRHSYLGKHLAGGWVTESQDKHTVEPQSRTLYTACGLHCEELRSNMQQNMEVSLKENPSILSIHVGLVLSHCSSWKFATMQVNKTENQCSLRSGR